MATLQKYNLSGEKTGELSIEEKLLKTQANSQLVKDYLVAIQANKRQWSASTQTRAEVSHSKKKPYAQKGTGNARQGFLGAAQFRGGGRVHAPKPKFDQYRQINRKEKRLAIRSLLCERINNQQSHILEYEPLTSPKTKTLAQFLFSLNMLGKRILFLVDDAQKKHEILFKSLRNLPKVEFCTLSNINGYDLALSHQLIILESAMDNLKATLGGTK